MPSAGLDPGFMYQVVLTYLLYYYRPAQARIETGVLVLAPAAAYAIGMLVARILDGVVDLPIASLDRQPAQPLGQPAPDDAAGHDPGHHLLRPAVVPALHRQEPGTGRSLGQCRVCGGGQFAVFLLPYLHHRPLPGGALGDRAG